MERFSGFGLQRWKEDEQCLVILIVSLKRERKKKRKKRKREHMVYKLSCRMAGCPNETKKKKQREA
jgi:hypothetical protein